MTGLHAAGFFFSAAACSSSVLLCFLLPLSFSVHSFILTHPHLPQQKKRAAGRSLKLRGGERITHRKTESCRDEGGGNKTNGEECTKGNEAKRKGATERSMITR